MFDTPARDPQKDFNHGIVAGARAAHPVNSTMDNSQNLKFKLDTLTKKDE